MAASGHIYFWRETEHPYGFLSQWYNAPFTAPPCSCVDAASETLTFLTTEQYMMYYKALVFKDQEVARKILLEANPKSQKALGRQVSNFDNKTWDLFKEKVVEEANYYKFTQSKVDGSKLRQALLDTDDKNLIEASPYDRIWGIGFSASTAASNHSNWGLNLLGKALMRVRERVK